jgi:hypothetical protein
MTDAILNQIRAALAFVNNERQNRQCSYEDESDYVQSALAIEFCLTAAIAGVERLALSPQLSGAIKDVERLSRQNADLQACNNRLLERARKADGLVAEYVEFLDKAIAERDAARADKDAALEAATVAVMQRDEARAEVERLRASIGFDASGGAAIAAKVELRS